MTYFTQRQPVGKQVMSSNVINTRIQAIIQWLWLTLKIMFHTPNSPHICSPSFLTQKILLESWNATYIGSKISLFQTLPHRNFQQTVRQGKWKLKCFQKSLNSMNSSKGQTHLVFHQHLHICLTISIKEMYADKAIPWQNETEKSANIKLL